MITSSNPANPNRNIKVITEPSVEPLTVAELKTFARIDGSDEDTLLETIIKAIRESMEFYLKRALIEQTITVSLDFWPGVMVELPYPPLISVEKVYLLDQSDDSTSYLSTNYYAVTDAIPGKIVLKDGVSPPDNSDRFVAGYAIEYKSGYGSQASNVPAGIRIGMMQWATMVYDGRALTTEPPDDVKQNLDLYRFMDI